MLGLLKNEKKTLTASELLISGIFGLWKKKKPKKQLDVFDVLVSLNKRKNSGAIVISDEQ